MENSQLGIPSVYVSEEFSLSRASVATERAVVNSEALSIKGQSTRDGTCSLPLCILSRDDPLARLVPISQTVAGSCENTAGFGLLRRGSFLAAMSAHGW